MLALVDCPPIPESLSEAAHCLRQVLRRRAEISKVPTDEFLLAWSSISYLMPGLHPDESNHDEGGWPVGWRGIAADAFRRYEVGEFSDAELYPYRSAQYGLGLL